jgi:ParB/RepB/Spo0J family partition protein
MTTTTDRLTTLPIARITLSSTAAQAARRKRFDKAELGELANSVRAHGILQPIICRSTATDYELVAGERRLLAAKAAGLEEIPAVVRALSDRAVIEIQLIENLQRADVHPMEEAEGYQQLLKTHGTPMEELHAKVGKSRSYVYGRLKLLALCSAARNAFYAGEIPASTALLIARIPSDKLQRQALDTLNRDGMSVRRAKDVIHDQYMLRLKGAPFPTADAELVKSAGPCNTCPKRTGNQPELFDDVQSADVCTDPPCFQAKVTAAAKRKLDAARAEGRQVITGAEAKRIAPYYNGAESGVTGGWVRTNKQIWEDPKQRTAGAIVGKDEPRALIECPKTGRVFEIIKAASVDREVRKSQPAGRTRGATSSQNQQQKKAKLERAFRAKLYARLRPQLPAPPMALTARTLYRQLDHECMKIVARLQGWEGTKSQYGPPGYRKLADKKVDGMTAEELRTFVNDCIYASELQVFPWSKAKPERLLAAAKAAKVNAAAVRRSVTPKPRKKKAAAARAKK